MANHTFRVVMVGNVGVGKTTIFTFLKQEREGEQQEIPSTGEDKKFRDSCTKTFVIAGGKEKIKMDIWDTGGTETYKTVPTNYYRNAEAVVLVYDVSNQKSVDSLRAWITEALNTAPKALLVLLGNKNDLKDETDGSADRIAEDCDIKMHYRVSAKYEDGVVEAFKVIAHELHSRRRITLGQAGAQNSRKGRGNTEGEIMVTENQLHPDKSRGDCCA